MVVRVSHKPEVSLYAYSTTSGSEFTTGEISEWSTIRIELRRDAVCATASCRLMPPPARIAGTSSERTRGNGSGSCSPKRLD